MVNLQETITIEKLNTIRDAIVERLRIAGLKEKKSSKDVPLAPAVITRGYVIDWLYDI